MTKVEDMPNSLVVDYRESLDRMIKSGGYEKVNPDVNEENFPLKGKEGVESIETSLLQFYHTPSASEIESMGYRPGQLAELLAFARVFPGWTNSFPVVAFGSVWKNDTGESYAPCVYGRHLLLVRLGSASWHESWRFLAIS